ncbi:MAG: MtrB/PioB family decaheme-associated outer membrane protein [Candidatus Rokubacteria bacterium]|nr:MtrB/PioB family decaheme-associated outer membrane protein [Candidatus Rokubacteria bacterium]
MTSMRITRLFAALAILASPGVAAAQLEAGGYRLSGEIEPGVRAYIDKPAQSRLGKLEEYRDLSSGPYLENLTLRLLRTDERLGLDFNGSRWGHDDQEFELRVGRIGKWQFGLEWGQIPHTYSTTSRFLATEPERGVYRLSPMRPALATHNAAPEGEVGMRTDTGRLLFSYSLSPDIDVSARYTITRRDGDRPRGMAFGSPGNNFYEVFEPIEQTIHDFRLGTNIARENWQLQFGYTASVFVNDLRRVRADNPCRPGAPAGCAAGDTGAAAPDTGQQALPPDNMAHTFTVNGGVSLPLRTRVTAGMSYALYLQNTEFLPHTINPTISNVDLLLPQDSLNGVVHNIHANLGVTSRPFALPLTLGAKYRLHQYLDESDEITFPGKVVNDRTLVQEARRAGRWSWNRQNVDLDGRYQLFAPVAMTLGTGVERWDRNRHREVEESNEFFGKAAVDATPFDWMTARLTYRPSFRRGERYNRLAHIEHSVVGEEVTSGNVQLNLLRKHDQADRDRQRVDALLQFTPTEALTISPTFGYRWDDYVDARAGLQKENAWNAGLDLTWNPFERLGLNLAYSHEHNRQFQRGRNRNGPGATFDVADYTWESKIRDTIDTFSGGLRFTFIPKVLDWAANASYQFALGRVETSNPVEPTSGTAANIAAAKAKPWPAFQDQILRIDTSLRYTFLKSWTASLGYVFESFQKDDWRTDRLEPFIPGVSMTWQGNDYRNYAAHIVGVTLRYRFGQ